MSSSMEGTGTDAEAARDWERVTERVARELFAIIEKKKLKKCEQAMYESNW